MDSKKFEQLIDFIINEDEEQARVLFHDIVVEKSREIYESIMDEEMADDMSGQVGDLMDEISAEETGGMTEDEFDLDSDEFGDSEADDISADETIDIDTGDIDTEDAGQDEEAIIRIEDKLDQLMAEFEQIMGSDQGGDDEEFGDEDEDLDGEDFGDETGEETTDDTEDVMEAVQLKQMGGQTYNTFGKMGDNGAQTRSPTAQNSGQAGMDSKPVTFSGHAETVPSSPKDPSNYGTKGQTLVKNANSFKNAPGQNSGKTSFTDKAPRDFGKKDTSSGRLVGADGSTPQNDKSPVAESKIAKRKTIK